MKIRIRNELIPLNLLVIVLIIVIVLLPSNVLRIVLGLPFLLFFPGYALVAAMFLRREGMSAIERVVLSLGMSIAVVSLIGLILNYTPWGVRLEPVLYSVSAFIFITSIIAWWRCKSLPEPGRFGIEFTLRLPGWGGSVWDRVLLVVLVISVLGVLGVLGYVVVKPGVGEKYTEFYVLGPEGIAANYRHELKVEDTLSVVVGITNQEREDTRYNVKISLSGIPLEELGPVMLHHEQNWEQTVNITVVKAGKNPRSSDKCNIPPQTQPSGPPGQSRHHLEAAIFRDPYLPVPTVIDPDISPVEARGMRPGQA